VLAALLRAALWLPTATTRLHASVPPNTGAYHHLFAINARHGLEPWLSFTGRFETTPAMPLVDGQRTSGRLFWRWTLQRLYNFFNTFRAGATLLVASTLWIATARGCTALPNEQRQFICLYLIPVAAAIYLPFSCSADDAYASPRRCQRLDAGVFLSPFSLPSCDHPPAVRHSLRYTARYSATVVATRFETTPPRVTRPFHHLAAA